MQCNQFQKVLQKTNHLYTILTNKSFVNYILK